MNVSGENRGRIINDKPRKQRENLVAKECCMEKVYDEREKNGVSKNNKTRIK